MQLIYQGQASQNAPQATTLWRKWVAANAFAELIGLGTVAALGYALFAYVGEPKGALSIVIAALAMCALGAFEGAVVGFLQGRALRKYVTGLSGWVRASVAGAVAAWIIGTLPSTIMQLAEAGVPNESANADMGFALTMLLAASMGVVAGPVLAVFQWRVLRNYVHQKAWLWLPANALAWGVGMPIILLGAQGQNWTQSPTLIALCVAASLFVAGAAVGTIHGSFLVRLLWQNGII